MFWGRKCITNKYFVLNITNKRPSQNQKYFAPLHPPTFCFFKLMHPKIQKIKISSRKQFPKENILEDSGKRNCPIDSHSDREDSLQILLSDFGFYFSLSVIKTKMKHWTESLHRLKIIEEFK